MKNYLFIILFILIRQIHAVGEAGAIFLVIPPTVISNGMGANGVCNMSDNHFGSYFNPANNYYPNQGISFSSSFSSVQWLPNLANDLYLRHYSNHLGLSKNDYLQFSFGYDRIYLDLGEQVGMDDKGSPTENYNAYMVSDALNCGIRFSNIKIFFPIKIMIGATRKKADQNFGGQIGTQVSQYDTGYWWEESQNSDNNYKSYTSNIFYDYGLLLEIQNGKSKFIKNNYKIYSKIIYGYSLSNLGDFISFGGASYMSDPAPRYARTGIGLKIIIESNNKQLVTWNIIHSAEDMLVRRTLENGAIYDYYDRGFGNIDLIDHIIFSYSSNGVIVNKGHEITIKDLISFRFGSIIDLEGKIENFTYGMSINASSYLKKLLRNNNQSKRSLLNLKLHFAYHAGEQGHPRANTMFFSSSLAINDINNIIKNYRSK